MIRASPTIMDESQLSVSDITMTSGEVSCSEGNSGGAINSLDINKIFFFLCLDLFKLLILNQLPPVIVLVAKL